MSSNSNLFDDQIDRQVEEFNQRMEASGNFHKYVLQVMCSERMRRDFEMQHSPSSISGVGKSLLRRVGRIGGIGRTRQRRPTNAPETSETQPDIIEGEFRVLSDLSDNQP